MDELWKNTERDAAKMKNMRNPNKKYILYVIQSIKNER